MLEAKPCLNPMVFGKQLSSEQCDLLWKSYGLQKCGRWTAVFGQHTDQI